MSNKQVIAGGLKLGPPEPFFVIAGPCVLESRELVFLIAEHLKNICAKHGVSFIFKASFDKANRSSVKSPRGPGIDEGLRILDDLKRKLQVPVLTDVHLPEQASAAAEVVDILQIPAFLCRQTDLLIACAETGKPVNVKKGQFLSPWEMKNVVDKIKSAGNNQILLTERGTTFGYNNLVVDFRSIPVMSSLGCLTVFDVTHSLQMPGGLGEKSGGQPQFIPTMAKAALAAGADGLFLETHPEPDKALSDGANSLQMDQFECLISQLVILDKALKEINEIEAK